MSVSFNKAKLAATDFSGASLYDAKFLGAVASVKCNFDGANLTRSNLEEAYLSKSTFVYANLTSANFAKAILHRAALTGATLKGTDFTKVDFERAELTGLDFRDCICRNAFFRHADMGRSCLEYLDLDAADFQDANLTNALLTATRMRGANLDRACLREAGLGEVDWENCSLRDADLTGASFHMGSSRSGLLFTTIASEGTRTGFYTDDYDDRSFKHPEEIRKANLCGCDLRGAKLDNVDFYLVDLRDARYDLEQEQQFRRCGAILGPRE